MAELNIAQAINGALGSALESDPTVIVLGEDVGATGGVFRVTDGLGERFGPDRVVDTPVAESGIIGAAFGMAIGGLKPVAEIQFMGFSYPAFDQIANHVSRIRNRSRHRFTAPMVIRIPYGAGIGAAEHHSESAEAIYAHTPGLKVVVPASPYDAKGLLLEAIADPDPVIFLEPIRLYRSIRQLVPDDPYTVPFGVAEIRRPGNDVTLIAYGAMVKETLEASEKLAAEGIGAEVLDLRSLVPLDADTIIESVEHTGRAVVIQEAPRTAGFATEIVSQIQERTLYSLAAPIQRVTGWDTVVPLRRAEHHFVPDAARIVAAARKTMES
ncbi:MAG TPA: alpha-ketoacid dehydrogenase subunit beta [Phycisphaerales bacterium]|jgi:pyruvate dehydrogenase E1 component beta subunit|nr:alpha-ketoacid dehydrogenase subunit beta [Chloroflexota bacterium]HCA38094.1 alpha-ketoacid dehydrogenase subunit beta [Phycisphaerales bacterium]|tara:strand:- start:932 stop:1909 length:978 start_codon:yes stop_codon:yes gene_type:complete